MIALVDYDNVPAPHRGPEYLIARLLDAIGVARLTVDANLRCRLYGGWFDHATLSRRAQRLAAALHAVFPKRMAVTHRGHGVLVRVGVELARTLAGDRLDMTHTFRRRAVPTGLGCLPGPFPGCAHPPQCPVAGMDRFINTAACPVAGCGVSTEQVLQRDEQKLVDAMLVADLIRLAQTTNELLVVVSSDDDMWPGIRVALLYGARVVHVHTRPRGASPYGLLATVNYAPVLGRWQ